MEGNFHDSKNSTAFAVGIITFIVGFIATVIISVSLDDIGPAFELVGVPVTVFLTVAVVNLLDKGKFSADEKSVAFSVGFSKYEYSYKNIIDARTKTIFTNGRYGAKIPHIELVISLRSGSIVRFSEGVPSYASDTIESLRKFQEKHQFTKLAYYIKSRL